MRNFYEKLIESLSFSFRVKAQNKTINPEIKELLQNYKFKKRGIVDKQIQEETKSIEKIKDSYEYKLFEHFAKINYLKKKEKSEYFLDRLNLDFYHNKKYWISKNNRFFRFHIRGLNTPKDFNWNIPIKILFLLIGLFMFKLGYANGQKDSMLYDEIKENIVDIKTEDQLFDILINQNMPTLVLYYIPGDHISYNMMFAQGKFIELYGEDKVKMAKVNCKFNLDLCLKKASYLSFPQWELMLPPFTETDSTGQEIKKFPVIPCKYDRSLEGIEGFMFSQGILPDKYNPLFIYNQAMRKYETI